MLDRLTAALKFQGEALALRAARQEVLASNIANADTPEYKARDFDFARALRDASGARAASATGPGASTATPRLALAPTGGGPGGSAASTPPPLAYRVARQASIDGNSVDLDQERANFADNALRYEATLRFINGGVRNLLSAIRGD